MAVIEIDRLVPRTPGIAPVCFGCKLQTKGQICLAIPAMRSYYRDIARGSILKSKLERISKELSQRPSDCPINP